MTKSEEGGGAICISVPHSKFWETWSTAGNYACGIRGRRTENGGSGRLQIGSAVTATKLPGGMTADAPRRLSQTEALQTMMMVSK